MSRVLGSEQGFGVWKLLDIRAGTAVVEEATSVPCSLVL